jgi:phosphoglycolate phosphatase-like HAD superfamily hydrolase
LFWDIDGTLLVTGRAGLVAWERAFAAVTGRATFPAVRPDGLTDHQIAAWLLDHASGDGDGRGVARSDGARDPVGELVGRYEVELEQALPLRQGRVLDHVTPVLEWIRADRPTMLCWLATGNTRLGGAAKLRYYGLASYFCSDPSDAASLEGCFSERVEPRANIVKRALERARRVVPGLAPTEALVIGDTPHDIEGAHAIGVPVLAVATNTHSLDELAVHGPWQTTPVLPGVEAFARLIDQPA